MKRQFAFAVLAAFCSIAADDPKPPRTVDLGGLTFEAPAAWKSVQPKSAMRRAQLVLPAVEPDKVGAELAVFVFPGGAGTVEANVERWRNQFRDDAGKPPKVESRKVEGKNVDVTRVEVAGTYTDTLNRIGPNPGWRLLGAIVETPQAGYFLKLVGPEKTVAAAREDFAKLMASLTKP